MILEIIRNFFMSSKSKRNILRTINEENICNIKYLTLFGHCINNNYPDTNYKFLNSFKDGTDCKYEVIYDEFRSGGLVSIGLSIKNGQLEFYEKWLP